MISILLAIAVGMATTAIEFTDDSLARVKENITKKKAVLVDVRSKDEWDKGHVAGAIFLPIDILEELPAEKVAKILPKDRILYTHCVIGMRAEAAGEILEEQGYKVHVLKPGYKELIEAGFKKHDESPR